MSVPKTSLYRERGENYPLSAKQSADKEYVQGRGQNEEDRAMMEMKAGMQNAENITFRAKAYTTLNNKLFGQLDNTKVLRTKDL